MAQATIKLPTLKQIAWSSTYTAVKRDRGWEKGEEGRKGEERKGKERAGCSRLVFFHFSILPSPVLKIKCTKIKFVKFLVNRYSI